MKKTIILCILISFSFGLLAQREGDASRQGEKRGTKAKKLSITKYDDATLFDFEGYYYYVNPNDYSDFSITFKDLDSLTPNSQSLETTDWEFYYRVLSEGDTLNWIEATSWFEPAGQADDWIIFGPLTIPENGAELSWKSYHNDSYRNGYEVLICTSGMNDYEDFTNEPLYVVEDLYNQNNDGIDTNTLFNDAPKSFEIPEQYNDTSIYIAFHHTANNMDIIHFTDILLKEKNTESIDEIVSIKSVRNYPNPAKGETTINFTTTKKSDFILSVFDLSGTKVVQKSIENLIPGEQSIALDLNRLAPGIYFYSLSDGNNSVTRKLVVSTYYTN
ncbi:MAG: T9SS type A sorting domain-containing protein [Bacteroidota bacterium]|nr:T9SS type A sorting domain-containing protein [Bacteroidota bacterium]